MSLYGKVGEEVRSMPKKDYVFMYLIFCLVGAGLEWSYGMFWNVVGTTPYIYPSSPLCYTSLEVLPCWGFGGLACVSIYRAFLWKKARFLLGTIPPLVLAALWVLIYSWFTA